MDQTIKTNQLEKEDLQRLTNIPGETSPKKNCLALQLCYVTMRWTGMGKRLPPNPYKN